MDSADEASAYAMDASSDFEPTVKPKTKVAPKKSAPATKPKAAKAVKQTTLKVTKTTAKPKKRAKPDSDDENSDTEARQANDDSLLSNTPPSAKKQKKATVNRKVTQPLAEVENESFIAEVAPTATNKTASEQFQKLTQYAHILKRPDTYIGSIEKTTEQMWVYNSETDSMENRKVTFVPGLYKIFDEIMVNAADNKQNDKNMNELRVWIDREKGLIGVKNNGRGIPVEIHQTEKIYIPEMIFGHLLTSSNYNDAEAKVTGGRNGYGAKLTNIYSTEFKLETVDTKSKQRYSQVWRDNMSKMEKARIVPTKKGDDDYTKITFMPDFARFGMDGIDDDFEALAKRRVYDMAGTVTGVKVYLNDNRIKVSKFKQYMELYTKAIKTESEGDEASTPAQVILTDSPHERWEIGFAMSDGAFQQVSFVNSIATSHGGTHVNYIADQICERLEDIVNKKNKGGVKMKKAQIRNHIFLFVNCLIINPAFTSQTKEQLTTKPSAFGSKPQVSEKFLKEIAKTEAVNRIIDFAQKKADKVLAKSDGNKRTRMNNAKLTDANRAGTKDGWKCTLILTEGDSASALALAGRAVVNPDHFGVFPLRGKILNVRDASIDQISKNQEIQNIKKFMGLQHKKDYTDTKGLRYGHLMIMTDQDHDGSHIKGLLINFLQVQFPSLLKLPGFLTEFITPIVKVWKGDTKNPRSKLDFFTMPEYEAWKLEPGHQKGWEHKYFKGLGTSDTKAAEEYFSDLDKHLKQFHTMREGEPELIDLAFSKKKADARKTWLQNFVPGTYLNMSGTDEITYDDFINKELILFSMADNLRSIPSVVDGFKPGQRKVMYTAFRRNIKKDIKVVGLAGAVMDMTAYAHGEGSLQQTIIGLAQDYCGSNNINVLEPSGNFGSRLQGGQDAASARYIYTRLSPFARRVFHQADEALLTYNTDDGHQIEPETYMPVIPMILVNGADGIGTGWSTQIPNYKPQDVIDNLMRRMDGDSKEVMFPMKPWFRGWSGEMEQSREDQFRANGKITVTGPNTVEVTELPVRFWTQDFKDKLEDIIRAEKTPSFIKDYTEYNTPEKVHFIIKIEEQKMVESVEKLIEMFKLTKTFATTNLVAFDAQGRIHKYATPLDMMEEFYQVRLRMYQKRRQHLLNELQQQLDKLSNQARFVKMIIDGKLVVSKKKKVALVAELQKLNFSRFPKVADARKNGENEEARDDSDNNDDASAEAGANDFDYLLGMAIWSLTQERIDKLNKQMAEKEAEVDVLSAKSPRDLWKEDLKELQQEWDIQLEEEAKRVKKIRSKGRRDSRKLGIGAKGGKKRKAGDDDDFSDSDFAVKKPKAIKSRTVGLLNMKVEGKPAGVYPIVNGIEQKPVIKPPGEQQFLVRPLSSSGVARTSESSEEVTGAAAKTTKPKGRAAAKPKAEDDDDMDDVFAAVAKEAQTAPAARAGRTGRIAAQKAKKYSLSSDEDEEDEDDAGNDLLDDVSAMVKGIGPGAGTSTVTSRLFHPQSGPVTSNGIAAKSKTASRGNLAAPDISEDETDWAALAQNSPQKAIGIATLAEDDSLVIDEVLSKAAPVKKTKPVAKKIKETVAPKAKKQSNVAALVPKILSPAAKAYAKKKAQAVVAVPASKSKRSAMDEEDDDDVDALVDEIISDNEDELDSEPVARPSRRAAASKAKSKYMVDDDESEEESEADFDDDEDESF